MCELFVLLVFFGNITMAIIYHIKNEYQKAIYHCLWAILSYMAIHNMGG